MVGKSIWGTLIAAAALLAAGGRASAQSADEVYKEGRDAHEAKQYARAETLLTKAIPALRAAYGDDHISVGFCHNWLARSQAAGHKYERALANCLQAYRIIRKRTPDDADEMCWAHYNIALMRDKLRDYSGAIKDYGLAATYAANGVEGDPAKFAPRLVWSTTGIGWCYQSLGLFAKAEPLHKRAIALAEKHLGADHAVTNWSVYSLGKFYVFHLGQFVDAEPLFDRCIRSMRGRDSSEATYGFALVDRAGLHLMNGHDAEAERLFREAVDYLDKLYGVASSEHAIAVWAYAACLVRLGKADQAERIARRMADNCKASHGEKSFRTADSMVNLARVCVPQRKFAEAEKLLTGAARFFERGTSYEECKL